MIKGPILDQYLQCPAVKMAGGGWVVRDQLLFGSLLMCKRVGPNYHEDPETQVGGLG